MADINAIAEQIQGLTLLEASQLVKLLEEKAGRFSRCGSRRGGPGRWRWRGSGSGSGRED